MNKGRGLHIARTRVRYVNEQTREARHVAELLAANEQPVDQERWPVPDLRCDWCDRVSLRLREASKLFEDESLTGSICRACVDREHQVREAEPGLYRGDSYERE